MNNVVVLSDFLLQYGKCKWLLECWREDRPIVKSLVSQEYSSVTMFNFLLERL